MTEMIGHVAETAGHDEPKTESVTMGRNPRSRYRNQRSRWSEIPRQTRMSIWTIWPRPWKTAVTTRLLSRAPVRCASAAKVSKRRRLGYVPSHSLSSKPTRPGRSASLTGAASLPARPRASGALPLPSDPLHSAAHRLVELLSHAARVIAPGRACSGAQTWNTLHFFSHASCWPSLACSR